MYSCPSGAARAAAAVLAGLLALAAPAAAVQEEADYAALADDFVRSHMPPELLGERAPAAVTVEELLDRCYVHAELGALRVHFPARGFVDPYSRRPKLLTYKRSANPGNAIEELSTMATALVEMQLAWVELVGSESPGERIDPRRTDEVLPGYRAVHDWVAEGWRNKGALKGLTDHLKQRKRDLSGRKPGAGGDELQALEPLDLEQLLADPEDDVHDALARFAAEMRGATFWGETPPEQLRAPRDVVICPTRGDVVGFALFAARARDLTQLTWHPGIFDYTQFSLPGLQAIGMGYAPEDDRQDLHYDRYMSDLDPPGNVVVQHAVRYGANALLEQYFGPSYVSQDPATPESLRRAQLVLGALYGGMRKYIVIHMYGRNQVRDEGDEANRTHARSIFIAGGNSEGGELGMIGAETSRWRKRANKEGDFFGDLVDNLELEREGTREEPLVTASFELQPLGSKRKNSHPVASPFLARTAESVLPPVPKRGDDEEEYEEQLQVRGELARDYVGFLRAYEIGFYQWLVREYRPAEGTAAQAHARLYRELHRRAAEYLAPDQPDYDLSERLVPAIQEVYGTSLTVPADQAGPERFRGTLEARFLVWLAARR